MENIKEMDYRNKMAQKVSIISMIINIVLGAGKLIVGILFASIAVVSDAIHSISDVFSTIVVIIGLHFAGKEADKKHNYGHEKIEPIVATILAVFLLILALMLGYTGIQGLIEIKVIEINILLLIVTIISIIAKEGLYWYTIYYAKKFNSPALKADAWHHRSDSISSVVVLGGLIGAMCGVMWLEPVATIILSLLIIKVAVSIYIQSINQLIDSAADDKTIKKIQEITMSIEGVLQIDDLKTRVHASVVYVDMEIGVDQNLILRESHEIADNVHDAIEREIENVKHCTVHVNPVSVEERE